MSSFPLEKLIIQPGAFRLFLAFLVFVSHVTRINTGRLGVILFFVLSGYWIARIWREQYKNSTVTWFYIGRYLRLMPVYLAIVLTAWLFLGGSLWPNLILIGIATTRGDVIGVSWSLDIELQFYALLPLVLMVIPRINTPIGAASLLVSCVGWYLFFTYEVATVLQYLPAFALGALIYEAKYRPDTRTAMISGAAFLAFTLIVLASPMRWIFDTTQTEDWQGDMFALIWILPIIPYVAASLTIKSSTIDRHLGNFTYPFYLVHYPIIFLMASQFSNKIVSKGGALAISIVVAAAFYFLVDRPAEKLRYSLIEKRREPMRKDSTPARSALP